MARNGIDRVMSTDVLDELFDLVVFVAKRTAVHGAGIFIDFVVFVESVQQGVNRRLFQYWLLQRNFIDAFHQVAKHRALAAAGGHGFAFQFLIQVFDTVIRGDCDRFGFPVNLDRLDSFDVVDHALVAQPAED